MKAVQIKNYGGAEVVEVDEIEKPVLKTGQVLVKNYASSINPFDIKLMSGIYKKMMPLNFPMTVGGDFSGVVESTGEEVYGSANVLSGGSGAIAEYVAANDENISLKPKTIDFSEAAPLVLVGVSAVQALEENIKLRAGQKILIHGGAGGIGSIAIQLAKSLGAYVATTVKKEDMEYVKKLGADQVIDYKLQDFSQILKNFDAVFDTVGGETTNKSFLVLKKDLPSGILVSMLGEPNQALAQEYGVTAIGQNTRVNKERLTRLSKFVDEGKIKPQIDKTFPIDFGRESFEYRQTVHPRGKVVIKIIE